MRDPHYPRTTKDAAFERDVLRCADLPVWTLDVFEIEDTLAAITLDANGCRWTSFEEVV